MSTQNGWVDQPLNDSHTVRKVLIIDGLAHATVEAFLNNGPYYPNAITPDNSPERGGPRTTLENAMQWCEQTTGYHVRPEKG